MSYTFQLNHHRSPESKYFLLVIEQKMREGELFIHTFAIENLPWHNLS